MKFSKSIMDRLIFSDVDYLGKAKSWYDGYKGLSKKDTAAAKAARKEHMTQQVEKETGKYVQRDSQPSSKSLNASLDAILEKGRKRESDRSAPKRVEESEGEGVELPGGSMATMGNPGGSKEKASFERAEPGAIKNLKKLAESPNKMDRKAAEAGLKRH